MTSFAGPTVVVSADERRPSTSACLDPRVASGYFGEENMVVFALDETALRELIEHDLEDVTRQTIIGVQEGRPEKRVSGKWKRTRLRGLLRGAGGHMTTLHRVGESCDSISPNLGAFVFPSGIRLADRHDSMDGRSDDRNVSCHSFVTTEGDGSYIYGHAVILWCPLVLPLDLVSDDDMYQQPLGFCLTSKKCYTRVFSTIFQELVASAGDATPPFPELRDRSQWNSQVQEWATKHLDFIYGEFHTRAFSTFRMLSSAVDERTTSEKLTDSPQRERYSFSMPRSSSESRISVEEGVDIGVHALANGEKVDVDPPSVDVDMSILFQHLEPCNILRVMRAMLNEERVVFQSDRVEVLLPTCETMIALLYPFRWPHIYVPVLPIDVAEISDGAYFDSPGAYFYGVPKTILTRCARLDDTVVQVDLDTNTVWGGDEQRSPELPFRAVLKLFAGILEHGGWVTFGQRANVEESSECPEIQPPGFPSDISPITKMLATRALAEIWVSTQTSKGGLVVRTCDVNEERDWRVASPIAKKESGEELCRGLKILKKAFATTDRASSFNLNITMGRSQDIIAGDALDSSGEDEGSSLVRAFSKAKKEDASKVFRQKKIQTVFMNFMITCFKSYAMYMKGNTFDKEAFLSAEGGDEQSQRFFSSFLRTQMFSCFAFSLESCLRHSPFANKAVQKMTRKLQVWKSISRRGFGSVCYVMSNSLMSTWEKVHMAIDFTAGTLNVYDYDTEVDVLTCAIERLLNTPNVRVDVDARDIWRFHPSQNSEQKLSKKIDSLLDDQPRLSELLNERNRLLNVNKRDSFSVAELDMQFSIPEKVKKGEYFSFCITLSPREEALSSSAKGLAPGEDNAVSLPVPQVAKRRLTVLSRLVRSITGSTDLSDIVCSVDSGKLRRSWLQRLVWLAKYYNMPKLTHMYEDKWQMGSVDEMTHRCRTHHLKLHKEFVDKGEERHSLSKDELREMMTENIISGKRSAHSRSHTVQ